MAAAMGHPRTRIRIDDDGRTLRHIPAGDLILQIELRVATDRHLRAFPCPCRDCHGVIRKRVEVVRKHHQLVGRDPFLTKSLLGGDPPEGYPSHGIWVEDIAYDDDIVEERASDIANAEVLPNEAPVDNVDQRNTVEPPLDEFHDVQRQVMEALDRGDALHRERSDVCSDEENDDNDSDGVDGLEELYEQATTPLYAGAKTSLVSAVVVIMNMCHVFRVSNTFTDELLHYLSEDLLPAGNKLPGSHYAARKTIRRLGLNYSNIHACPDGCILYDAENTELNSCPNCSKSRWLEGSNSIPAKVIRHFPLIPRLKRMWRSKEIAGMLTGYTKHISADGIMRSVVDSPAWKHIDTDVAFGNFGVEKRNMRFAMALDGVNPFKLNNTNWSTWPVLILTYNFEPWFVTKKFFISLCLLISGKHSPTAKNIGVYLRPLLDELNELWNGVPALDFSQDEGHRRFLLRGVLMWTISDFPAYGLISGVTCKGYKGCVSCGPETDARLAKTGDIFADRRSRRSKIVYGGMRRYLPRHHPYRRNKRFNGRTERRFEPPIMSNLDVIKYAAWRQSYLDLGGRENGKDDPVHVTGVKLLPELFILSYWQHLLAPHILDVMHCEKNLCENILKTILGMKDTAGSRQDVQDLNVREEIWLQPSHRGHNELYMPPAPYILKPEERREFVNIVANIRTPTNYVGSIHKRLTDGKLQYMKTHDYHVLMQTILPVAVRNVLDEKVRLAIIKVSRVFQRLCEKEVRKSDESELMRNVVLASCMLEKEFPPTFLNIMAHLPVHLVQQLFLCGPVHCRWMYPIERYMKTLKDHVRTLAHPEGSMAEGYRMEDALGFCTEYLKEYRGTSHRVWDAAEEAQMNDEILRTNQRKKRKLKDDVRQYAHAFVLDNAESLQPWREEYIAAKGQRWADREAFRIQSRRNRPQVAVKYPTELRDLPAFTEWVTSKVERMRRAGQHLNDDIVQYAQPPERYATSHRHMHAFGMHLRVRSSEDALVTRDSGVVATFTRQLRWGLQNGRPMECSDDHVGYIEEILELDYRNHCTTVLLCDWVKPTRDIRNPSIERDRYGFSMANFNHMDGQVHANSFAFPLHCQQVFFSDDPHKPGWKVICRTDVRGRRGELQLHQLNPAVTEVGHDDSFEGLDPEMLQTEPRRDAQFDGGQYVVPVEGVNVPNEDEDVLST